MSRAREPLPPDGAAGAALGPPEPAAALAPPSPADKARRALWGLVWRLAFRPVPTPLHGVRRGLLRLFGARIGAGARPYPAARIWAPWNLDMGAASCLANGVECYNVAPVVLGAGAVVSQRAHLCTASHDHRDPGFALIAAPIRIGPRAWVAAEAFVGPGAGLAEGAVAGARAVVTRSVPAWTVVAGNPARIVGTRRPGEARD